MTLPPPRSTLFPYTTLFRSSNSPGNVARKARVPSKQPATRPTIAANLGREARSEERRVGKECRSQWRPYHVKTKQRQQIHGRLGMRGMKGQDVRVAQRAERK